MDKWLHKISECFKIFIKKKENGGRREQSCQILARSLLDLQIRFVDSALLNQSPSTSLVGFQLKFWLEDSVQYRWEPQNWIKSWL